VVYGHNRYPAVQGSTRQACCLLDNYYDSKDNTYYVKASWRVAQSYAFCSQHLAANTFQNIFKKCSNLRNSKYVVCDVSWLTLCSPLTGACRRKPRPVLIITSVFCFSICNILLAWKKNHVLLLQFGLLLDMDNSCLPSLIQEFVPEVIPSKKRPLSMASILNCLGALGIWNLRIYWGQGCTDPGIQVAAVQHVIYGPTL
jgi:hypothetical protein